MENERWSFSKNTWKYDISFECLESMVFPKQLHWNMIFLVASSRKIIFFPENMILFFRWKMKDDLSQKIHGNMIFLSNASKAWSFQSNRTGIWSFLYIWKDGIFFPGKYYIFSFHGKWKMIFLKKYKEIWSFLYICINVTNMILTFCKKKKSKMIFSRKNTLTADWHSRSHSRKGFNDFLYFYGDLHRHFHMLLSSEKKSGNLIYTIEIWLLLQFIW